MGEKDQEKGKDDQRADWLSPWIGRAGGLALVLATWLSILFPKEEHKPLAYGVAAGVTAAYAGYLYWRGRHRPPEPMPLTPEPIGTSLLRSFLPFEQGDLLIGRRGDIADAVAILQASEFRFGVLWGESGCGKTSFLRAGLVPELQRRGYGAVYLNRPTTNPIAAIKAELEGVSANARAFVIIDQFEEYFLSNTGHTMAANLAKGLKQILEESPRSALLIAIRRDFFAKLQNFAPDIPDPTSPRTTIELANLRSEAAREVLAQAAADKAVQFERALIDAVIEDLERDGEVWPVDLQLIGTRLKRAHVQQKAVYVALGRKPGVIGTFIRDEVARLSKPMLGEIILRKLCAPGGIAKSPVDVTLESIAEDVNARAPSLLAGTELLTCLKSLQEARIIIQTSDNTFNLTHDALAALIMRGTTGLPGKTESADRSISFYLSAFRDDRQVRIPLRTLLQIRRHGTPATLSDRQVRELINKSWGNAALTVSWPAALAMAVLMCVGYGIAISTWSIGTAPAVFASGPPSVVIRSGTGATQFLPGANRLIAETDLGIDQLDPRNAVAADHVPRGEISGLGSVQNAVPQIADIIRPLDKIRFLRHAGRPEAAASAFAALVARDDMSTRAVRAASDAIGLTARTDQGTETSVIIKALIHTRETAVSPAAKLAADAALLRMAENQNSIAERVSLTMPHALAILKQRIVAAKPLERDPNLDTLQVESALTLLMLNGLSMPTEHDLVVFQQILDNEKNDSWARARNFRLLEFYPARDSRLANPVLQYLLATARRHASDPGWLTWGAMKALPKIARNHPEALQGVLATATGADSLLTKPNDKQIEAVAIPISMIGRTPVKALPASFAATLRNRAHDQTASASVRTTASIALCHLAAAVPDLQDPEATRIVIDLLRDTPQVAVELQRLRREAISAAADLAAAGQLDADSVQIALKSLGRLLRNRHSSGTSEWNDDNVGRDLQRLASAGGQVDEHLVDGIIQSITRPAYTGEDSTAADMLIAAANASPALVLGKQAVLEKIDLRNGIGNEFNRPLRLKILASLGQADAAAGTISDSFDPCVAKLMKQQSSDTRQRGAFCLFFLALRDPHLLPQLKAQLLPMLDESPIRQITARMTLEMLADVQRIADAKKNSSLIAITRAQLRHDLLDAEAHVAIAARASLEALAMLPP